MLNNGYLFFRENISDKLSLKLVIVIGKDARKSVQSVAVTSDK